MLDLKPVYAKRQRSLRRTVLVVMAVVAFHALLVLGIIDLFGYSTAVRLPWLIKVKIVPAPPPTVLPVKLQAVSRHS
jgi:hypothetical protein